jgi:hypothetical protein
MANTPKQALLTIQLEYLIQVLPRRLNFMNGTFYN